MSKLLTLLIIFLFSSHAYSQTTKGHVITAVNKYVSSTLDLDPNDNIYITGNEIHLFIDVYGNFINNYIPTNSTKKNTFKFYIVGHSDTLNKLNFIFRATANYEPSKFHIRSQKSIQNQEDKRENSTNIIIEELITIKESTEKYKIKIDKFFTESNKVTIIDADIPIIKTFYADLCIALVGSTLKNSEEIEEYLLEDGNKTLVSDNDNIYTPVLSTNIVLYPTGRTFMPNEKDKIGIMLGVKMGSKLNDNFLTGIQYSNSKFRVDIVGGVHLGNINTIVNQDDFEYGKTIFKGDINNSVKKKWQTGLFLGINIHTSIMKNLFI